MARTALCRGAGTAGEGLAHLCVVHPLSDTGFDLAVVHARFLAGTQWARAQCRQPSRLLQGVDGPRYRCGPADGAGVGRGERTPGSVLRPDAGHDLYVAAASRPAPDGRRLPGLDRDHGAVDRLASSADVAGADGPDGAYQLPDAIPDPEPGLPRLRPGSVREHSARAADVAVRGDPRVPVRVQCAVAESVPLDRKSTRLNSSH